MKSVDANYIIRIVTNDYPKLAREAWTALHAAPPRSVALADYVISEAIYVLEFHDGYDFSRQQIAEGMRLALELESLVCDTALHDAALAVYETSRFDYVDCLLIAEVQLKRRAAVLSFDKKLQAWLARVGFE